MNNINCSNSDYMIILLIHSSLELLYKYSVFKAIQKNRVAYFSTWLNANFNTSHRRRVVAQKI